MQEQEKVWKTRQECLEHIPHSLPRLLQSVQWDNGIQVTQVSGPTLLRTTAHLLV